MFWYALAGLCGGIIAGMGMGGGTLTIPLLTLILGMNQLEAQAVNLIAFIPMAFVTLIIHIKNKLVNFKILFYVLPLAVALAVAGAFFTKSVAEDTLRKIFGAFMLIVGAFFIAKTLGSMIKDRLSDHKMA